MNYFAVSSPPWSMAPSEFAQKMISRWSATVIKKQRPEDSNDFDFELEMPHSLVVGGFARSGDCFVMDGDLRDMAQLALWFRSLVPPEHQVIFCDEVCGYGNGDHITLTSETTEEEILKALGYIPRP